MNEIIKSNQREPSPVIHWSTNDYNQIISFFNALGNWQTQYDFSGWNHATDAVFTSNLTYNDETGKFYTSKTEIVNGELNVIGLTFDANLKPVSFSGEGYPGAFVYQPTDSYWKKILISLDGGLEYYDGHFNWYVDYSGRITGLAPRIITGMPPMLGRASNIEKMGVAIGKMSANKNIQKEQIESLVKKYHLNKQQRRTLHDEVSHQGYGYKEIEEIIKEMFNK